MAIEELMPIDGGHRRMFVGGAWIDADEGQTMHTLDPATGKVLATVPCGQKADIDKAVAAARSAFNGPWSRFKPAERQQLLLRIADLFEAHWDEISRSDTLDMGMPITRTRSNRTRVIGMLSYYAGLATAIHGDTIENSLPGDVASWTLKEPVGVVGAIIPWNAPSAASIWKIGPALATGCAIVLKPSEEAPLTPLLIARLMEEAGVPAGVVNVVTGTGTEAGAPLASHADVDKVVFTGSTETGQAIVRASAGNLKRLSMELGGKSPVIVCADADLDKAVPTAAMAAFANSGQICIAGSRLLIEKSVYPEFVDRLAAFADRLTVGSGIDPATEIGPLISTRQRDRVERYLKLGVSEGATIVAGGDLLTRGEHADGNFVAPTVFTAVDDNMTIAREEIFGPVIACMPFDTIDEAVSRANSTPYGLAAGLFTSDLSKAFKVSRSIHAGSVWINTYHAIDPALPFGGYKMSGFGREGGREHLDEYLNTKSIFANIE